jgi:pimeloyl-ACP methyl ester carboxylesterase
VADRRALAACTAAVLVVAGCSGPHTRGGDGPRPSATSGTAAATGAAARWKACPEVPARIVGRGAPTMRYDCATIAVPRNWSAPAGGTFDISLIRARNKDQRDRIGSLLINPGGPGVSGVNAAVYLSFGKAYGGVSEDVTRRFDIIGFDPRGVDRSSPLECLSDQQMDQSFGYDPDPGTTAAFDGAVTLSRQMGEACQARYGDLLRLYSTEQAARDIDAIRAAVGDPKLTYLGYSYGTLLGATYAQLYPRNVRALVLDGAVDPRQDFVAGSESQAKGFELAFDNFAKWCANTPRKCPIAPDAGGAVERAIEKGRTDPVVGARGRKATAGWIFYAVVDSLYSQSGWQQLAEAIDNLDRGDPAGVFDLADSYAERDPNGHYSNQFDASIAITCADQRAAPTVAQVRTLQSEWRTRYPLFGAPLAVGMLTCALWPGQHDPYPTGAADGSPPILVVGTTGDPATPYEQSPRLAQMLGVGRLLTWNGEGHTAYPKSTCVVSAVDSYLIDLMVPAAGKRCS